MKLNKIEFGLMNSPIRAFIQSNYEIKPFLNWKDKLTGKEILEIGCGNGFGTQLINSCFHPAKVTGTDLDGEMIKIARKNYSQFSFAIEDTTDMKFPDNYFDAVIDFGVIHHISDWKKALREVYRVTKGKGMVFLEDFSRESFQSVGGRFFRKFLDHPYDDIPPRKEFSDYCETLGFKIIRQEVRNPLGLLNFFVLILEK